MNLLAGYASDEDETVPTVNTANATTAPDSGKKRKNEQPVDEAPNSKKAKTEAQTKRSAPAKGKGKLPSAAALLQNIPDELMHGTQQEEPEVDSTGTKYNRVAPPTALLKEAEDQKEDWSVKPLASVDKRKPVFAKTVSSSSKSGSEDATSAPKPAGCAFTLLITCLMCHVFRSGVCSATSGNREAQYQY